MKQLISCEFNIDTAYVELKYSNVQKSPSQPHLHAI